ncbi:MAG: hypothetical protein ACMUJM_05635 [bacterium]
MENAKIISEKSKKNEILEAYNELLNKVKSQKPLDRQAEIAQVEKKKVVNAASQLSVEKIIKDLADIKLEIGKLFDNLEGKLVTQYKQFTELQQATEIEKKKLEELHEIKANADSLAALLLAQKEKQLSFEREMEEKKRDFESAMSEKRAQWQKEQEAFLLAQKEKDSQIKKERQREEEEYTYNLKLTRKKDSDAYEEKKAAREKELNEKKAALEKELNEKKALAEREFAEREAAMGAKEKEFDHLRAQVETFPKQLEKSIKDTEKAVSERLEIKYAHLAELTAKEIEGERKLYRQSVEALEAKIKTQDALIQQLTQKTNLAGQQVQDIAMKAIEGAAAHRIFTTSFEKKTDEGHSAQ